MEVLGRYWRTRQGTCGHVFPAIAAFTPCPECPRVPARAQPDVPVWYPRLVVCLQNEQRVKGDCSLHADCVLRRPCAGVGKRSDSPSGALRRPCRRQPAAGARAPGRATPSHVPRTMKIEKLDQQPWRCVEDVRAAVFDWTERGYDRRRRHSSLGYLSPPRVRKPTLRRTPDHQPLTCPPKRGNFTVRSSTGTRVHRAERPTSH
jgi:hypothetical protein